MAELNDRLRHCILSVFPMVTETDLLTQSLDQLLSMDSLAAVTLVALIDEEFGVDLDLQDLMELATCQALQERLSCYSVVRTDEAKKQ